jgi:hypothetical protein
MAYGKEHTKLKLIESGGRRGEERRRGVIA